MCCVTPVTRRGGIRPSRQAWTTPMARSSRADRAAAVRQCRAGDPGVREDHDRGTDSAGDPCRAGTRAPAQVAHPPDRPPDPRPDPDDEEIVLAVGDLAQPTADPAGGPVLVEPGTKATAALLHRGSVSASTPSGRSRQAGTVPAIMGDPHRSRSVIRPRWTVPPEFRWHVRHCLRQDRERRFRPRRAGASTSPNSHVGTDATSHVAQGLAAREQVAARSWFRTPRRAGRCPLHTPRKVITPQGTLAAIAESRGHHR